MGIKQQVVGKSWEMEIIDAYNKRNFFTYKIPTMNSGTVFDIIVARKGCCMMIEAKHIEGDKLSYSGCGIEKKHDEIEHFVNTTGNNIYIYVKSDTTGMWWTTWVRAKESFMTKGYITKEDCIPLSLERGCVSVEEENI